MTKGIKGSGSKVLSLRCLLFTQEEMTALQWDIMKCTTLKNDIGWSMTLKSGLIHKVLTMDERAYRKET